MQESKEEKEFRKDLSNSLKESNNIFAESMKAMSTSTCPHSYFNDNNQLTIRLIMMIMVKIRETLQRFYFGLYCPYQKSNMADRLLI
jgi:hypothetical protein